MMDAYRYAIILAACLAVTVPLEIVLGARVYRRPRLLVASVVPAAAAFVGWDLIAAARGVWWFADRYVLGPRFLGLPVEEFVFFAIVPTCALLTYEAVGALLGRMRTRRGDTHAR